MCCCRRFGWSTGAVAARVKRPAGSSHLRFFADLPHFTLSRSPTEPDGSIVLGVAENKITSEVLHVSKKLESRRIAAAVFAPQSPFWTDKPGRPPTPSTTQQAAINELGPFPQELLGYQAWRGIPALGKALKAMLESTFMKVGGWVRNMEGSGRRLVEGCGHSELWCCAWPTRCADW
jgi:hypothetical protein